jgi:hypothetical protein
MNPDSHALTPGAPNLAQPHLDDEVVATPELTLEMVETTAKQVQINASESQK